MEYIDARIDEKIYKWHDRCDALDTRHTMFCRAELRAALGLPAER